MNRFARAFESVLWNSRFVTLLAVVASLIGALALFYVALIDVVAVLKLLGGYTDFSLSVVDHAHVRGKIVVGVAEFIDAFLFAIVLLIFALGIYELFVGRLRAGPHPELAHRIFHVENLDELKERLAKVIFLILVVRYFEYALETPIATPLDLLALAGGIALVALGIYLTSPRGSQL